MRLWAPLQLLPIAIFLIGETTGVRPIWKTPISSSSHRNATSRQNRARNSEPAASQDLPAPPYYTRPEDFKVPSYQPPRPQNGAPPPYRIPITPPGFRPQPRPFPIQNRYQQRPPYPQGQQQYYQRQQYPPQSYPQYPQNPYHNQPYPNGWNPWSAQVPPRGLPYLNGVPPIPPQGVYGPPVNTKAPMIPAVRPDTYTGTIPMAPSVSPESAPQPTSPPLTPEEVTMSSLFTAKQNPYEQVEEKIAPITQRQTEPTPPPTTTLAQETLNPYETSLTASPAPSEEAYAPSVTPNEEVPAAFGTTVPPYGTAIEDITSGAYETTELHYGSQETTESTVAPPTEAFFPRPAFTQAYQPPAPSPKEESAQFIDVKLVQPNKPCIGPLCGIDKEKVSLYTPPKGPTLVISNAAKGESERTGSTAPTRHYGEQSTRGPSPSVPERKLIPYVPGLETPPPYQQPPSQIARGPHMFMPPQNFPAPPVPAPTSTQRPYDYTEYGHEAYSPTAKTLAPPPEYEQTPPPYPEIDRHAPSARPPSPESFYTSPPPGNQYEEETTPIHETVPPYEQTTTEEEFTTQPYEQTTETPSRPAHEGPTSFVPTYKPRYPETTPTPQTPPTRSPTTQPNGQTPRPGEFPGRTPPPGAFPGRTPPQGPSHGQTPPPGQLPGETPPPGAFPGQTTPPSVVPGQTPPTRPFPGQTPPTERTPPPGQTPPPPAFPGGTTPPRPIQHSETPPPGVFPGQTPPPGGFPESTPPSPVGPGETPPPRDLPGHTPPSGRFPGETPPPGRFPGETPPPGRFPGETPPPGRFPGETPPPGRFPGETRPPGSFPGETTPPARFTEQTPPQPFPGHTPPPSIVPSETPSPGRFPGQTTPPPAFPGETPPPSPSSGQTPPPSVFPGQTPPTVVTGQTPPSREFPGQTPPPQLQPGESPPTPFTRETSPHPTLIPSQTPPPSSEFPSRPPLHPEEVTSPTPFSQPSSPSPSESTPYYVETTLTTRSPYKPPEPKLVVPNRVRGKVRVVCREDGIEFGVVTLFPFTGQIFANDRKRVPSCVQSFNEQVAPTMFLPFAECGGKNAGDKEQRTQYHMQVVVMIDQKDGSSSIQSYLAQCVHQEIQYSKQQLPRRIEETLEELRLVPTHLEQKALLPQVEMRILVDEHHQLGPEVSEVDIGMPLALHWRLIGESDAYGFHVRNCMVADTISGMEVMLVDENGCSTDLSILDHPHYDTYHDTAAAHMWAFKVPDHTSLRVKCDVTICSDITATSSNISSCAAIPSPPFCPDLITSPPNSILYDAEGAFLKRRRNTESTEETQTVRAALCMGHACRQHSQEWRSCVDALWLSISTAGSLATLIIAATINIIVRTRTNSSAADSSVRSGRM